MFDTKIYRCTCGCGGNNCQMKFCDENCRRYNIQPRRSFSQEIMERSIYDRGYYDGQKDTWREFKKERELLRNGADQERFAKLLREAIVPLEDLLKKLE